MGVSGRSNLARFARFDAPAAVAASCDDARWPIQHMIYISQFQKLLHSNTFQIVFCVVWLFRNLIRLVVSSIAMCGWAHVPTLHQTKQNHNAAWQILQQTFFKNIACVILFVRKLPSSSFCFFRLGLKSGSVRSTRKTSYKTVRKMFWRTYIQNVA